MKRDDLPIRRDTPEYQVGLDAYSQGVSDSKNPYPQSDRRRVDWYNGWLDARTRDRLRGIVRRDWPAEVADL